VLDEADRMLDMGFIRDVKRIIALLPKSVNELRRQNLLFSATFSDEIKALADGLLDKPKMIEVARRNTTAELVEQKVVMSEKVHKRALLAHLIKTNRWVQVLVFTRTKHGANRLAEQLGKDGITALAIHGNKSQSARTRALAEFKGGTLQVLVATDIAARGLDIVELPHVVNYELPNVPEDYVHRIGRTGRAGASGEAISLVASDERAYLADIERLIKRQIPRVQVPGFVFDARAVTIEEPRPPMPPRRNPPRKPATAPARGGNNGNRNQGSGNAQGRPGQPGNAAQPARPAQRPQQRPALGGGANRPRTGGGRGR